MISSVSYGKSYAKKCLVEWKPVTDTISVQFKTHIIEVPVTGAFNNVDFTICSPTDRLADASIKAKIQTRDVTSESPLVASTLKQKEWMNVRQYPQGTFQSKNITFISDNNYRISGILCLRNICKDYHVPFSYIYDDTKNQGILKGMATLNRFDYNIGTDSMKSIFVSDTLDLIVNIAVTKKINLDE